MRRPYKNTREDDHDYGVSDTDARDNQCCAIGGRSGVFHRIGCGAVARKEEDEEKETAVALAVALLSFGVELVYMRQKHDHCMPTCAIPSRPAKQGKPSISWQQAISAREVGSTKILAKAQVPLVVPSRTK